MSSQRTPKSPTLADVARATGVSAQTVSRVINGRAGVAAATRERVLRSINQMSYRPNIVARSLATNLNKTIGLIVTDFAQGFFPDTTHSIESEASRSGYATYIATIADDGARLDKTLDHLRDNRLAGVIINASVIEQAAELQQAMDDGFPIVLIHEELPGNSSVIKWPGYQIGGRIATEHLLSLGRTRIGYIATRSGSLNDKDKLKGYFEALEKAGIEADSSYVAYASRDFQGGYAAMAELLRCHPDIDGVFASSDVRAVGALRYLVTTGYQVPNDIALVGFGGSTIASMVTPSLSTISVPRREIGQAAVKLLLQRLAGEEIEPGLVYHQPTLLLGESSIPRVGPAFKSSSLKFARPPTLG